MRSRSRLDDELTAPVRGSTWYCPPRGSTGNCCTTPCNIRSSSFKGSPPVFSSIPANAFFQKVQILFLHNFLHPLHEGFTNPFVCHSAREAIQKLERRGGIPALNRHTGSQSRKIGWSPRDRAPQSEDSAPAAGLQSS